MKTDETNQAQKEKDTGLAILLILLIVILFSKNQIYLYPAMAVLVLTMTWPKFFAPFSYIWFGFSKVLGEVVSKILLSLVFLLVAMPIGMTRKLMGIDTMKLNQWKKENDSYFTDCQKNLTADNLKRPF